MSTFSSLWERNSTFIFIPLSSLFKSISFSINFPLCSIPLKALQLKMEERPLFRVWLGSISERGPYVLLSFLEVLTFDRSVPKMKEVSFIRSFDSPIVESFKELFPYPNTSQEIFSSDYKKKAIITFTRIAKPYSLVIKWRGAHWDQKDHSSQVNVKIKKHVSIFGFLPSAKITRTKLVWKHVHIPDQYYFDTKSAVEKLLRNLKQYVEQKAQERK